MFKPEKCAGCPAEAVMFIKIGSFQLWMCEAHARETQENLTTMIEDVDRTGGTQVRHIDREWAGVEEIEHFCHEPFLRANLHKFWLPKIRVDGEEMTCGHKGDGDDQRPDCAVDLAKFTTATAAQTFAEEYRDRELGTSQGKGA